jgi:hypothetical protein
MSHFPSSKEIVLSSTPKVSLYHHVLGESIACFTAAYHLGNSPDREKGKACAEGAGVLNRGENEATPQAERLGKLLVHGHKPKVVGMFIMPGLVYELSNLLNNIMLIAGVPEESARSIFEPVFTTKPADESDGLGLFLARQAVMKLGGDIRLQSREGNGATFVVQLPASSDSTQKTDGA